jgi:hypothetical protein
MKEIPTHQNKFNSLVYRVPLEDVHPRLKKISRAFGKLVPRASQMHIRDMEKLHNPNLTIPFAAKQAASVPA